MVTETKIENAYRDTLLQEMEQNAMRPLGGRLNYYEMAQELLDGVISRGKRLLIMSSSYKNPQSCVVVTLDKTYAQFATGHVMNKLSGEKIPYTLNYYSLIDNNTKISIIEED